MMPNLPSVLPHLTACLNDPHPLVKSITCWTLGRYAKWTVDPPGDLVTNDEQLQHHLSTYFRPILEGLLRMMMDNNKRVQEAGCSAMATLQEEANEKLEPYLEPILRCFAAAFDRYQVWFRKD